MTKLTHINPDNMAPYLQYGLSHAVAVEGGKTVYLSGQVGWDENGNTVEMEGNGVEIVRRQADGTWKFIIDNPWGSG